MADNILVFYGSYRSDRAGIRLADFIVAGLTARGAEAELIDAKVVGLPMLDRMYKEYPKGAAPAAMEAMADKIRRADAFVFVAGEYNWGPQPGLKNLTDHFLEEWFWRPAAIASYSRGRMSGARSNSIWHAILSEMGMSVISTTVTVGQITQTLDESGVPTGAAGEALSKAFTRFADDLSWWTEAVKSQKSAQSAAVLIPSSPEIDWPHNYSEDNGDRRLAAWTGRNAGPFALRGWLGRRVDGNPLSWAGYYGPG